MANFTASRVSTERVRKLRFFEPRQYVSIDYARRDLLVIRLDGSVPPEIAAAVAGGQIDPAVLAQLAAAGLRGPGPGLSFVKPPVTPGEPLRLEIESFLDAVRTRASLALQRDRARCVGAGAGDSGVDGCACCARRAAGLLRAAAARASLAIESY